MQSTIEDLNISGFLENSFVDWDGYITSVIFLPGCNFKCPFCHNPELINCDKSNSNKINPSFVLDFLSGKKEWIDGLTVTGGEPTLHIDRLIPFLRRVKEIGIEIKIDTNGTNPTAIQKLIDLSLVGYFAMDVKAKLDDSSYGESSGVAGFCDRIKESIKIIIDSGVNHEFRTTVVPSLVSDSDIYDIAKSVSGCKLYVLQKFHPENVLDESFKKIEPLEDSDMRELEKVASEFVPVKLRLR